jgi:hypothetical protein
MPTVFVFKAIKPKKMKVDAIRLEILGELRKEGTVQRKELRKTTSGWRGEKPKFESLVGLGRPPGGASVLTGPTGSTKAVNKWVWTDQGTRPHLIRARRAPRLRFQTGYVPSTTPKKFTSRRSRRFGPTVRPKVVRHPGTKARGWTELLSKRRKRPFTKRMIKAMQRGATKVF